MGTRSSKKRKMESEKINFSTSLFDLPVEVLISLGKYLRIRDIFKFRCYSRYSKELGDAMLSAVHKLTVSPRFPRNEMLLRVILQECHRLRRIRILVNGDKGIFTDEMLENLLSNNPLLEEIMIENASAFTLKALAPLATCCKNLVKLTFCGSLLSNEFLKIFNAHNNHLLEVSFRFGWESTDNMMEVWEFLKNQPKLQSISLPHIYSFEDHEPFYERILSTIAEVCKELTYLEIPWDIPTAGFHIGISKIADNCPKLNTIDFEFNAKISDELINYLNSKNIEVVGNYRQEALEFFESEESSDESFGSFEFHDPDDYDDGIYDSDFSD